MNKKLHLMKSTSRKIKEIREDNINIVIKQNQKLIEECNLLRTENGAYYKEIRKADIMLKQSVQSHEKLRELRKGKEHKSVGKLSELERRVQEQKEALQRQRHSINRLLENKS